MKKTTCNCVTFLRDATLSVFPLRSKPRGKKAKRIIAVLIAVLMLMVFMPTSVFAADVGTAEDLESGANLTGTEVYFGNYGGNPIKWYVVATDAGTATLWTTTNMGNRRYDSDMHNDWRGSEICGWLNRTASGGFLFDAFSTKEQTAIATNYSTTPEQGSSGGQFIPNQKIVLPSVAEIGDDDSTGTWQIQYTGTVDNKRGFGDQWWLRSPGGNFFRAAIVRDGGNVDSPGLDVSSYYTATRPAFKLNLASVIFTSDAVGGKSVTVGADLSAVQAPRAGAVKLTVEDIYNSSTNPTGLALGTVTPDSISGRTVSFDYSGATVSDALSAIVSDSSGLKYYGQLEDSIDASGNGTASVTIPSDFVVGSDKLEIFVEEINGDNLTDFASVRKAISVKSKTAPAATSGEEKITGVNDTMEYSSDAGTTWTSVGAGQTEITGLSAGSYDVRYKNVVESGTVYIDNAAATVTVTAPPPPPINHNPTNPPNVNTPVDTSKALTIKFEGEYANLKAVRLNNVNLTVTPTSNIQANLSGYKNYDKVLGNAKAGSVEVTLNKEFLQWLPNGVQSLEVEFNDGGVISSGKADFLIKHEAKPAANTNTKGSVKTGDSTPRGILIGLNVLAGVALTFIIFRKKFRTTR